MKLSQELGKIFESEMAKVIQAEIDNPGFLGQEHFCNCESRAFAGVACAMPRVAKVLALSIAAHREKDHAENHGAEIEHLSMELSPEEVEIGTRGFWGN